MSACYIFSGIDEEDTTIKCQETAQTLCHEMGQEFSDEWDEFFTALTICNTVVVSSQPVIVDDSVRSTPSLTPQTENKEGKRISLPNASVKKLSTSSFDKKLSNGSSTKSRSKTLPSLPPDIPTDITMPPDIIIERTFSREGKENSDTDSDIGHEHLRIENNPSVRVFANRLSDRLSRSVDSINSWMHYGLIPNYQFESPDEGALVLAATSYGYKLASRTPEQIFFTTPSDEIKIFDILHVLQFDSTRKRMSIIVRDDKGKIKVYCKGADTAIMVRLEERQGKVF